MRATFACAAAESSRVAHRAADVHRAFAAQRGKSRMHLTRERTRLRAQLDIPRPNAFVGKFVGEILHDGERFPHMHIVVDQHRDEARRRVLRQRRCLKSGLPSGVPNGNQDFLERNAERLHGDPRPERPRGIVLVADDELHAASAGRRFTSGQSYSNFGMTQVSRNAARRHSCHAGSAVIACM